MATEPDESHTGQSYGIIQIEGNTQAVLGNVSALHSTHYHIESIRIAARPNSKLITRTKRSRTHHERPALIRKASKKSTQRLTLSPEPDLDEGGETLKHGNDGHDGNSNDDLLETSNLIRRFLISAYRRLPDPPKPLWRISTPQEQPLNQDAYFGESQTDLPAHHATTSSLTITPAARDLLVLCTGTLSFLLGRNVSVQDLIGLVSRCQQDRCLPLLTFLLGIGMYRYWVLSSINTAPVTQYFIMLEDAYGRTRPLPFEVCCDFSILQKFLEVHYQQSSSTAGAALIRAGRFNLRLGSRSGKLGFTSGRIVASDEWSSPVHIRRGTRIINSIIASVEDDEASEIMQSIPLGETELILLSYYLSPQYVFDDCMGRTLDPCTLLMCFDRSRSRPAEDDIIMHAFGGIDNPRCEISFKNIDLLIVPRTNSESSARYDERCFVRTLRAPDGGLLPIELLESMFDV